jgi:cyanophycinase
LTKKDGGTLVIIGGAEDKTGECEILREFFSLAGGRKSRLNVLSTASEDPEAGDQYRRIFLDMGAEEVRVLAVQNRKEANQAQFFRFFDDNSGIFFTGGDQLRITGILGGSILGTALHRAYVTGAIVAGTSAGASAMSETMLVGGLDDATPKKEIIRMAPGLGLLNGVVVDQHFAQRGRIGRLLAAVAHNPYILGVGIDEDTAIVVRESGSFKVIGSGAVTVIDGKQVSHSNVSESDSDQSLALTDVCLHLLARDYGFHLKERYVMMPGTKEENK